MSRRTDTLGLIDSIIIIVIGIDIIGIDIIGISVSSLAKIRLK